MLGNFIYHYHVLSSISLVWWEMGAMRLYHYHVLSSISLVWWEMGAMRKQANGVKFLISIARSKKQETYLPSGMW
jgi:hypothetical protein